MEPKITSEVKYDDRRKELTHLTKEEKDTEFGKLIIESKGTYHEEGIRKILKSFEERKEVIEKNIETLKELQNPIPDLKRETELERLKENLKILQLIKHKEDISDEDLKKEAENLKQNEKDLKEVKKDISDIKNTIGTRLKI